MSFILFKVDLKRNWVLLLIFFAVLTMYMTVMIGMYDPQDVDALESMMEMLPPDIMSAFGFNEAIIDLTGFLASWLYGLLMLGFPLVYSSILGNRLVAKMVENGSMAYLLSTPTSRSKVIITKAIYSLASILVLFAALFAIGVLTCNAMFPGLLDINGFLRLNFTTMLVNMLVIMICFFFSTVFNESKFAVGFGTGIPLLFLLMKMLGGVAGESSVLQDISIYGFYDSVEIAAGGESLTVNLVYLAMIAILFVASVMIFRRRRLPI